MMNSRLAQIVAASIGEDGKPNREKIYRELQLTPNAPEAILIDAYVATEGAVASWQREAMRIERDTASILAAAASLSDKVIRIAFIGGMATGAGTCVFGIAVWAHYFSR